MKSVDHPPILPRALVRLVAAFCVMAMIPIHARAEPLPDQKNNSSPIKIGGVLHLTGEFSVQGKAFREGMELGADAARESGTAVQLIFEDTQYSAIRSVTAAKKLISSDSVAAAVISTAVEAKAAGPEFQRAGVPAVVLWDSSPELEAIGNYIFSIGPWIPSSGERMARFAATRLHAKTASIVHTNTEWSAAVASAFRAEFERAGGKVVTIANENPSETDFRTTLMKAKRANPDVFYTPVDANLIAFFNQAKQLQIAPPLLTSDIVTEDNLEEDMNAFQGLYQSMPRAAEGGARADMLARYQKKFGKPCTQGLFVAWGFDAVRIIAAAASRAGKNIAGQGIAGAEIRKEMLLTKNFPGASSEISMNEHGTSAAPLGIFRIEGKGFKELKEHQP